MKTSAQVVVIGDRVESCVVLYRLTKLRWSNVMLVERSELSSGSTWHAASGFHTLNGINNKVALQGYTIRLYKDLEKITGLSYGLHHVAGVNHADNQDRFDMLLADRAKHRYMGLQTEIISPKEIATFALLINIHEIIGVFYDPLDSYLDPSGTKNTSNAKAARLGGTN